MTKIKNLSDEILIALLKDGEVAAFEEVYNRYWEKLYNTAAKRVKASENAEEIVQDFFTSLWLNREKVNLHSSFNNYAFSSIRYLVYNHYQKESVRKAYQENRIRLSVVEDNSTEEFIALKELRHVVAEGVEKLPSKCKVVYELSRKEYKNNKEIAALLGISEKTVENHLTKALRNIRLSLKDAMSFIALIFHFLNQY